MDENLLPKFSSLLGENILRRNLIGFTCYFLLSFDLLTFLVFSFSILFFTFLFFQFFFYLIKLHTVYTCVFGNIEEASLTRNEYCWFLFWIQYNLCLIFSIICFLTWFIELHINCSIPMYYMLQSKFKCWESMWHLLKKLLLLLLLFSS